MLRLDKRLSKLLLEASAEAKESRSAEGITTLDFVLAEIDDAKSELYSYIVTSTFVDPNDIQVILETATEEIEEEIQYTQSVKVTDKNGKSIEVKFTEEMAEYLNVASEIAQKIEKDEIGPDDMIAAIITDPPKEVTKLFRSLQIDILDLERLYVPDSYKADSKSETEIPQDMRGYLSLIKGDKDISGRDAELKSAWKILMKKTKRNFILVGDQGVGKTAIVYKMAAQIEDGVAPEQFKNFKIFAVDVNAIISGTTYRGEAEERFDDLINFIKRNQNAILFIDEAHLILGAGACRDGDIDLANALKPILAGEYSRVIAATTRYEYEKYFSVDGALKRRFEKITVKEAKNDEVPKMIEKKVKSLSEYHGVSIDAKTVRDIIIYASCFNNETKNPDRTLDLIDRAMVTAKLNGKTKVDQDSILDNFEINLRAFQKTTSSEKLATAYHETGHFLAFYYLPYLRKVCKPIAVSIYPTDHYLGITSIDTDEDLHGCTSKKEYIEQMAGYLAGGIAESMFTGEMNDGISSDASQATKIARRLVSDTGVMEGFFFHDERLKTEKMIDSESEMIKELLKEANAIVKKLLQEHRTELEKIAKRLVQKGIMTTEEIEKVMNPANSRRKEKART